MTSANDRICIASADGHVGPPTEVYKDYLPKKLHRAFDEYLERHVWRWAPQSKDSYFPPEKNSKFWDTEGFDPAHGTAVTWDPSLRLKAMDESMVACEVLCPDDQSMNDPPWGSGLANAFIEGPSGLPHPPELVRAGARAYNRWLADFCSADPDRLGGLINLGTLDDILWCTDEVERAYEAGLHAGILLPLEYDLPLYHHPRYEMIWEVCSQLQLPVVTHVGRGSPNYLGDDPRVQLMVSSIEGFGAAYHLQPVRTLILGGVLERYPDLKLVVTESGFDWVLPLLEAMDSLFEWWPKMRASQNTDVHVHFSMKPSDYFRRQCFVTHSTAQRREEFEGEAYDKLPNTIFGADIGHDEGWWPVFGFPEPVPEGQPAFFELPVSAVEDTYKVLWGGLRASKIVPYLQDNFFRAYPNVDRAALERVAQRVCPTLDELGLVKDT